MNKTFSIVVPVYQNEANLEDTIPKLLGLREVLSNYALEIVLVDDGSSDASLAILTKFAHEFPDNIIVVKLTRNFGQTPAVQAGLRQARGDCVGVIAADLQEPFEMFVEMIKQWECGGHFVIGERRAREEGKGHQFVSNLYWNLIRHFAFPDFPKLGYDFFLVDRQVVDDINRINEKNSSIYALIYWLGYRPIRIPITRRARRQGMSQWNFWKKAVFTLDTLIAFTYLPARTITTMGFAVATLCVGYFLVMATLWYRLRAAPPGWMTVVGFLSLLGAMILIALGIVSEYLLRILDESRKRPPYVIEKIIPPIKIDNASDVTRSVES